MQGRTRESEDQDSKEMFSPSPSGRARYVHME
jgi:hypothetical protein